MTTTYPPADYGIPDSPYQQPNPPPIEDDDTHTAIGNVADVLHAVQEIRAAAPAYRKALDYYGGAVPEVFASQAIRRQVRASSDAYPVNLAKRVVNVILARLKLTAVVAVDKDNPVDSVDDQAATDADENLDVTPAEGDYGKTATAWINSQILRNELDLEWTALHRMVGVFGDAYVTVWPADDGDDAAVEQGPPPKPVPRATDVDIYINDPIGMRVFYDEENPRERAYAAKLWETREKRKRVSLYYPDRVEKWITKPTPTGSAPLSGSEAADWAQFDDGSGDWPIFHEFGEVPVFHFRSDRPYGCSDLADAYGAQNAVSKLVASLMAAIDYHAFPQRWALSGGTVDGIGGTEGDEWDEDVAPDPSASGLESGAGQLWLLRNIQRVGEFSAGSVHNLLEPLSMMMRLMSTTTSTPLRYFDPTRDPPSGSAIRELESVTDDNAIERQKMLTAEYRKMWALVLTMGAFEPDRLVIDIRWRPTQVISDLAGWQTAQIKLLVGVPVRQALIETGYPADLVDHWLSTSSEDDVTTQVNLLVQIATLLGQLDGRAPTDDATAQLTALTTQLVTTLREQLAPDAKVTPLQPAPPPQAFGDDTAAPAEDGLISGERPSPLPATDSEEGL